jgi:hypothetical protein
MIGNRASLRMRSLLSLKFELKLMSKAHGMDDTDLFDINKIYRL